MPNTRAAQPAESLEGETDNDSKEPDSREALELSAPLFHQEERTTVPARRRSPKYVRVLVPHAGCAVKADDDGQ